MNYWLDVFSGTTWDEFRKDGAIITGFNQRFRKQATKIKEGDLFLCYLTGVKRWVGVLENLGPTMEKRKIWSEADFPVRFKVRPRIMLDPEYGVPMDALSSKVDFFRGPEDAGGFKGFLRFSPNRFKRDEDGQLVLRLLQEAERNPVSHPVDQAKLYRKLFKAELKKGRKSVPTLVAIPGHDEQPPSPKPEPAPDETAAATEHVQAQYLLLSLGAELGYDVWVARNDRGKVCSGTALGDLPRCVTKLPKMPSDAADKTVELIDVLWLQRNSIVAAFEVECTTAIYSGLLRMSDLMALHPHLNIGLYIVAPEERREKVAQEILRPTFRILERPLSEICGFLPLSVLKKKIEGARSLELLPSLKADFISQMAERFAEDDQLS